MEHNSIMKNRFDMVIFTSVMLLISLGVVTVYSSSSIIALTRFHDGYHFLKKHIIYAVSGVILMFAVSKIDYRLYRNAAYPILIGALLLLIIVLIPQMGVEISGSRRWIKLAGLTFQPGEFMKIAMIIYMAHSLTKKADRIRSFSQGIIPHMMVLGLTLLLMLLQPDFGSSMLIASVVMVMIYAAGARPVHIISLLLMAMPAVIVLIIREPYRWRRIMAYMNPWADPDDVGFQIIHSFYAFGSGGVLGVGLGEGSQKMLYLPAPFTDFIYSTIAEEAGLIGSILIIFLFLVFILRGLKVTRCTGDTFGKYLALGITTLIGLQAFINMSVVMGVLPTKGLPLPFISYGGSSIITCMLAAGILLNISSQISGGE